MALQDLAMEDSMGSAEILFVNELSIENLRNSWERHCRIGRVEKKVRDVPIFTPAWDFRPDKNGVLLL